MSWRDEAACFGESRLFFGGTQADHKAAKAICATCPVIGECRAEWHRARNETGYAFPGVWFGTTEDERRCGRAVVHGRETAYRNGCRCIECVENMRRLSRERAARARLVAS